MPHFSTFVPTIQTTQRAVHNEAHDKPIYFAYFEAIYHTYSQANCTTNRASNHSSHIQTHSKALDTLAAAFKSTLQPTLPYSIPTTNLQTNGVAYLHPCTFQETYGPAKQRPYHPINRSTDISSQWPTIPWAYPTNEPALPSPESTTDRSAL